MLSLRSITVSYPDGVGSRHRAVDDVSITIASGEHVALLGANGSGKSSLMRCALGLSHLDRGSVSVDGFDPFAPESAVAARSLLGFVGQRPDNQMVATSVEDEVAFGPENLGLPREEIRARVDEALAAVGLIGVHRREPHTLSGGQKQRLAIAGALAMHPRYLLLDEPTSMLDEPSRRSVTDLIATLIRGGIGALHITHDLKEAVHADRVVVLSEGSVVFDGVYADLVSLGDAALREWGIELRSPAVVRLAEPIQLGRDRIELRGVSVSYDIGYHDRMTALRGADFSVAPGELVVIKGPTGSGKSTLMMVCAGLVEPDSGVSSIDGLPLSLTTTRGRVGLMFQDPESALFAETVIDDVMFGPLNFGETRADARVTAEASLREAGLDPAHYGDRSPFTLSGGEARLAAIAGVLAIKPRYLLADEPTSALDARGRLAVRTLLIGAADRCGVVVVTHSPEEFESAADRVYELDGGTLRLTGEGRSR